MLAPMAFDMAVMLVACAAVILIILVRDKANERFESGRYREFDSALRARLRPSWPDDGLHRPRLSAQRNNRLPHDSGSSWRHDPVRV
jgi:hypothetical protein